MNQKHKTGSIVLIVFFFLTFPLSLTIGKIENSQSEGGMMKLESSAFKNGQPIPKKYTCSGNDTSPPLRIVDAPKGTKSFALIVDDPDAPSGTFDHWLAWNISSTTQELTEGVKVPNQGENGFGDLRYRGPCPPPGKPHRYFFKLYALDTMLTLKDGVSKAQLEHALEGHILGQAELMGTFQR